MGRRLREYGITAGTLGSTASQTMMVVLLPVLLAEYTDSALLIGLAIGGEGMFAILVPYWIGSASDSLPHGIAERFGRRTLFLAVTAPLMAVALVAAPFVRGFWALAAVALVFFAAFHAYLTPLWALLVDAVPDRRRGRVQGVRGALHAGGLGVGLVGGGLLYAAWRPLPFLVAAALLLATTWISVRAAPTGALHAEAMPHQEHGGWRELLRPPQVRWFLAANSLWTGAIDGVRPYVFLFAITVLGVGTARASLAMIGLAVGLGLGAVIVGRLGDRFSRFRLLELAGLVTAVALASGTFVRDLASAAVLLAGAGLGGAALIALPYPVFASLVEARQMGRYTGLYVLSAGIARVVAPVLVGAAIELGERIQPELAGFPFMWSAGALLALGGAAALRVAERHAPARRRVAVSR